MEVEKMGELRRGGLPTVAPVIMDEGEVEMDYSFAVEYNGPPVSYDIPRALPIDIAHIPTAAVVVPTSVTDLLALPIVQPLPLPDHWKKTSKGGESVVSPTSVISFDRSAIDGHARELSGDGSKESLAEIESSGALEFSNGQDQLRDLSVEIGDSCILGSSNKCDQSGEMSVGSLGTVGFSNGTRQSCELSEELGSSGSLSFSNGHDLSRGGSLSEIGSSGQLRFPKDFKDSLDFSNDTNPPDWISMESVLSSALSSEDSSRKAEENCEGLPGSHSKKASIVTFQEAESDDMIETAVTPDYADSTQGSKKSDWKLKKGSCHRCLKGNRFTEKEACLVCNAKFCSTCVLRAMGSMPEGRKCITCIGSPIDESKRESLGKCSRMLKRLFNSLEIHQVMKAEKSCEVNQLQPEHIYVNGEQLSQEEMHLLQGCPNPPSKLKPGRYWYDKVSGLWGKEGHKPCNIVTPNLNVGGILMSDASDGNSQVFINNREITKPELQMLKWAGVHCAGNPHFWVNADGSYQEEGQKNIRGNIWGKAGTKLICSLFSLPVPHKPGNASGEENNRIIKAVPGYLEHLQKLLLVGSHGSGTSTIFKQAKFLYKAVPFSEEERESLKCMIQSNVYRYLGIILEGRERFEEENLMETRKRLLDESADLGNYDEKINRTIYTISPKLKAFSDWLLKVMGSGSLEAIFPAATREYAPLVEEMWKDAAIQATYSRRQELQMLPSRASYFLERVVDIAKMEYEPSDADILHAEGVTSSSGLTCTEFLFPPSHYDDTIDAADQHDQMLRYQLIRVNAKGFGENWKWLEMFEDVQIVIFCVALSDYNEFCDNGSGVSQNKMLLNKKLFESMVSHPTFEQIDFLLVLNKFDLLEEKLAQVPLTACNWFDSFHPVVSRHNSSSRNNNTNGISIGQQAFHYIASKFKSLFCSLTGRKLYVSPMKGLDAGSVDEALRYAREIIKWDEEKPFFCINENSIFSTEASSFSH